LCAAQSASAVTVQYTTVGKFTSTGTNTTILDVGPNTSSVAFTNGGDIASINPGEIAQMSLGSFAVSSTSSTNVVASDTFTLDITQLSPTGGTPQFVGQLSGTVRVLNSQLVIAFNNVTASAYPVNYQLINLGGGTLLDNELGLSYNSSTTLKAAVSVVPLPATANMGLGLIVCVAGAGIWRKRKSGQAALD